MRNALTFDVEDYFNGVRTLGVYSPESWGSFEPRIERMTHVVLDILDRRQLKATFFVLAAAAQRHPSLVPEIARRGHEIASHGFGHELIYKQTPQAFRDDLVRGKSIVEDQLGAPVFGYRAPAFSIISETEWAFDVIADVGFTYDSSVFPIRGHDTYGLPDTPVVPWAAGEGLLEIPLTTSRIAKVNVPVGGGAYFRFYPYAVTKWMLKRINQAGRAAVTYFHPWEFDVDQPTIEGSRKARFRHHVNRRRMAKRFDALCDDFEFGPIREVFAEDLQKSAPLGTVR